MKYNENEIILAVDSHYGQYTPQVFIERYGEFLTTPLDEESKKIFVEGPDNQFYWDDWCYILDNNTVKLTTYEGNAPTEYKIIENEDLWLVPINMELPDEWYI